MDTTIYREPGRSEEADAVHRTVAGVVMISLGAAMMYFALVPSFEAGSEVAGCVGDRGASHARYEASGGCEAAHLYRTGGAEP